MTEAGPEPRLDSFGNPLRPEPVRPPRFLRLSRTLWISSVLVGFVQSFIQMLDRQRLNTVYHLLQPELSQRQLDDAVNDGILSTLLFSAATLLIYISLTRMLLAGRNWARIVFTVFGAIALLRAVFLVLFVSLIGSGPVRALFGMDISPVDVGFTVVVAAIEVTATVLMFMAGCNGFFKESADRQRRGNAVGSIGDGA